MADYGLAVGRLAVTTALDELREGWGDGLDAVGATLVGAEAKPRA